MENKTLSARLLAILALLLVVSVVAVSALKGLKPDLQFLLGHARGSLQQAAISLVNQFRLDTHLFWGPLVAMLLVERFYPAAKGQKLFTVGFCEDLLWFTTAPLFGVLLVWPFNSYFKAAYHHYFDFVSIPVLLGLPVPVQVIIVILAVDFMSWFSHLLKHKVKLFWHFHAVHHSQKEMNFLTDLRIHPVEKMISFVIRFFPMTLLELRHGVPLGIAWWLFTTWHTMFYHANIRSNYGFLRYVFVTPQSHRIHHSQLPQHQDLNFGVIFSFWDRIFGTQYKNAEEYPDTGVADKEFPVERSYNVWSLIVTLLRQLIYPFQSILRRGV